MESSVVVKIFRLIEALAASEEEQPLGELAEQVELAKPTAHRLLKLMVQLGYVKRNEGGLYRLSGKLQQLARGNQSSSLLAAARPVLARIHRQTGETVNLGVLRQGKVVYQHVIESRHPLRRIAEPNATDPFYSTALGRSIVAHLPEQRQRAMLESASTLRRRTSATVTDRRQLLEILRVVRTQGYAVEQDQTDLGVTCVGAPLFRDDEVVAAISISVPTARASAKRLAELTPIVRQGAAKISRSLSSARQLAVAI
jgi:DNA-binding IclR family transcriptional regulator